MPKKAPSASKAGRRRARSAGAPHAFAIEPHWDIGIVDEALVSDGLYATFHVQAGDEASARRVLDTARAAFQGLVDGPRHNEALPNFVKAIHEAMLPVTQAPPAASPEEPGDEKRGQALAEVMLLARDGHALSVLWVGSYRLGVLRRGKVLLPAVLPHEKMVDDRPLLTEVLGHRHRVARVTLTTEPGDVWFIGTRRILDIEPDDLRNLLEQARTADVTSKLRSFAAVTAPIPGTPIEPTIGEGPSLRWAALQSVGMRPRQEDAFRLVPEHGVFVIGDGLGGHEGGPEASRITVDTFADVLVAEGSWVPVLETARRATELARARVSRATDGASTVDALRVRDGDMHIAHVGDSRVYRFRDGALLPMTHDHSEVADLVRKGELTEAEARVHPRRNIITQAIGSSMTLAKPDAVVAPVAPGDLWILSTDGLHGVIDDDAITKVLASSGDDLGAAAQRLVDAAFDAGAPDNVTVVLVQLTAPPKPPKAKSNTKAKATKRAPRKPSHRAS